MSKAVILPFTPESTQQAAEALKQGDVVAMPTETVYGLAGDAMNPEALTRIFSTKERPTFDPLIVHVGFAARGMYALAAADLVDLRPLSPEAQERAEKLIQAFWPGPLTLVLPKSARVPDLATSGLPSVALRMPRHPAAQALIAAAGTPLAAPSANRFGRISPTTAQAVAEELGDRISFILDGGPCEVGVESTVVRVENDGALTLLRPGGIAREQLEAAAGTSLRAPLVPVIEQTAQVAGLAAPGMLKSHYAPVKQLDMLPKSVETLTHAEFSTVSQHLSCAGLLAFMGDAKKLEHEFARLLGGPRVVVRVLSPKGDPAEAARNLFQSLRELDASEASRLFSEPCPWTSGLGHAIRDRLERAASR